MGIYSYNSQSNGTHCKELFKLRAWLKHCMPPAGWYDAMQTLMKELCCTTSHPTTRRDDFILVECLVKHSSVHDVGRGASCSSCAQRVAVDGSDSEVEAPTPQIGSQSRSTSTAPLQL